MLYLNFKINVSKWEKTLKISISSLYLQIILPEALTEANIWDNWIATPLCYKFTHVYVYIKYCAKYLILHIVLSLYTSNFSENKSTQIIRRILDPTSAKHHLLEKICSKWKMPWCAKANIQTEYSSTF